MSTNNLSPETQHVKNCLEIITLGQMCPSEEAIQELRSDGMQGALKVSRDHLQAMIYAGKQMLETFPAENSEDVIMQLEKKLEVINSSIVEPSEGSCYEDGVEEAIVTQMFLAKLAGKREEADLLFVELEQLHSHGSVFL